MSYQVIARKYRPQNFAQVLGQEPVSQTLQNAIAQKRIHHAYLFTGARGIGKTTVARILAKSLNCAKGPAKEPCNACELCQEITLGNSMDVQEIDGASNTSVDDVREIREQVKYLPAKGRYKIYIIDEVHMLSTSAFNALLKTLEEPPPHVIFIFATTEVHKIPSTILSRCQRYDFKRLPSKEIIENLSKIAKEEKIGIDDSSLHLIAKESQGSLRDAQSLLDQAIAFCGSKVEYARLNKLFGFLDRSQLLDFTTSLVCRETEKALDLLESFFQSGTDLSRLAQEVVEQFRHLFLIKQTGKVSEWLGLSPEEEKVFGDLVKKREASELDQMFWLMLRSAEEIMRSQFPKMVFEVTIARLKQIESARSVEELIQRLEEGSGTMTRTTPVTKGAPIQVASSPDWNGFLKWLGSERPQIASLLSHGKYISTNGETVLYHFGSGGAIYAEMLQESDRQKQMEALLQQFFKKPLHLRIEQEEKVSETNSTPDKRKKKEEMERKVLQSSAVKEATEILGAQVFEVRTEEKG